MNRIYHIGISGGDSWERIQNILRVEEPATIPQIRHWLLDDLSVREIDQVLEQMRESRAVTMELTEDESGRLTVIWWYGVHTNQ